MPSLLSAATNEALLRATGGVAVVKGAQTTYGHLKKAPITALRGEDGAGGVLTADARVVIANGRLTGITAEDGIGDTVTVDSVDYTIVDIVQPQGEEDGDMLELVLRRSS